MTSLTEILLSIAESGIDVYLYFEASTKNTFISRPTVNIAKAEKDLTPTLLLDLYRMTAQNIKAMKLMRLKTNKIFDADIMS